MSDHDVVLYGSDDDAPCHHVVGFVAEAIQKGGGAVVIATPDHVRAFRAALAALSIDTNSEILKDRLHFLDAHETLDALSLNGHVDRTRFDRVVGTLVRSLYNRYEVSAYGEMVGILRDAQKPEEAARLETFWCELLEELSFRLVCGYPIDVLSKEFHPDEMDAILCSHTKLRSLMEEHFSESLRVATIKGSAELPQPSRRPKWAMLPDTEATLLWLREHLPDHADDVIRYAKASGRTVPEPSFE